MCRQTSHSQDRHAENATFCSLLESSEDGVLALELAHAIGVRRIRCSVGLVAVRGSVTVKDIVRRDVDEEKRMLRRPRQGREERGDADIQLLHCLGVLSVPKWLVRIRI